MDKRSDFQYVGGSIEKEEKDEKLPIIRKKKVVKKPRSQTVKLRLLKSLQVNSIGSVTGKRYSWARGGSVVDVDIRDKDKLLKKTGNPVSCCDDVVDQPYFELVE